MYSCIFDAIECQKNETVLMIIVAGFFLSCNVYKHIFLLMTCSFLTLTHFPILTHTNDNLGAQKGFLDPYIQKNMLVLVETSFFPSLCG